MLNDCPMLDIEQHAPWQDIHVETTCSGSIINKTAEQSNILWVSSPPTFGPSAVQLLDTRLACHGGIAHAVGPALSAQPA